MHTPTPEIISIMKQYLLVAAVALFAVSASAQDFQKYKIAFKINPNIGWMTPQNNNMEATGSSARFGFGIATDILFTENYAIGTGLNIDNMGGQLTYLTQKTEFSGQPEESIYIVEKERTFNLKYVELPLTLKMRTNEIGYMTYWGQFGLGLGVNWRANADDTDNYMRIFDDVSGGWDGTDKADFTEENIEISDDINILRASLIIGAGLEYNLSGSTSLVAGLTYNNGFTNIFQRDALGIERQQDDTPLINPSGPSEFKLKSNNSTIGLTIGILF